MPNAYITLTGEKIELSGLTHEEKMFLGRAVKAYEAGEAFPNFVNHVNTPGSPALQGGQWVTEKVAASPLYRVCQDLGDRLGVAQSFLALGENSSTDDAGFTERNEPDYVSCEDAANQAGVTPEAIRRAIREDRLPARKVGRTYLLERKAVEAYAVRSGRRPPAARRINDRTIRDTTA